jgi:anti-sigma regulatory factor (Ser/Thr protein kinase)
VSEQRFSNAPAAVRHARRFVTECLDDIDGETLDMVALMVSELATNAVRHAQSPFSVRVERDGDRVRVAVTDRGTGRPQARRPAPTDPRGRGLLIVQELSDEWGVDAKREGKTVWFVVRTEPAPTARGSDTTR